MAHKRILWFIFCLSLPLRSICVPVPLLSLSSSYNGIKIMFNSFNNLVPFIFSIMSFFTMMNCILQIQEHSKKDRPRQNSASVRHRCPRGISVPQGEIRQPAILHQRGAQDNSAKIPQGGHQEGQGRHHDAHPSSQSIQEQGSDEVSRRCCQPRGEPSAILSLTTSRHTVETSLTKENT